MRLHHHLCNRCGQEFTSLMATPSQGLLCTPCTNAEDVALIAASGPSLASLYRAGVASGLINRKQAYA